MISFYRQNAQKKGFFYRHKTNLQTALSRFYIKARIESLNNEKSMDKDA
ncbi:hypothetical protein PULV_a0219 [Pseudoalteromonas ulvae UL12]|nr:hypothetical protein [Pseudoalteromonas ulvae UL12]